MRYVVRWTPADRGSCWGTHSVVDTDGRPHERALKTYPLAEEWAWTQYAAEAEAYRLQLEYERMTHRLETERLIAATSARLQGFAALVDVFRVPA